MAVSAMILSPTNPVEADAPEPCRVHRKWVGGPRGALAEEERGRCGRAWRGGAGIIAQEGTGAVLWADRVLGGMASSARPNWWAGQRFLLRAYPIPYPLTPATETYPERDPA